jgi:hypothetical protein
VGGRGGIPHTVPQDPIRIDVEDLRSRATALGFVVTAWNEDSGIIDGNGDAFVGTHQEIALFLRGWRAAQIATAREMNERIRGYDLLTFSSDGMIIAPGAEYTIYRRPQLFRVLRMSIPDRIAKCFDVEIWVGNRQVMGRTPGLVFSTRADLAPELTAHRNETSGLIRVEMSDAVLVAFGVPLKVPTCQTDQDLRIVGHADSSSKSGSEFTAVLLGVAMVESSRRA